jgi:hypothetical protein
MSSFKIFPLLGCPVCPQPTGVMSTNDGNRTQTCMECKLSFVKDGVLHQKVAELIEPLKKEFESRQSDKSLCFKPKMRTPSQDNSEYFVFQNPYLVCPECDNKCSACDPQPKFYSLLGWTLQGCSGCNVNYIMTDCGPFGCETKNSILVKIEKGKEILSKQKPQDENVKSGSTVFGSDLAYKPSFFESMINKVIRLPKQIQKMESIAKIEPDYKVEKPELIADQYCSCPPGFRVSILIRDKFGNSLCPTCRKVDKKTDCLPTDEQRPSSTSQIITKILAQSVTGWLEVSCHCYETSPCQHYISFNETNLKVKYELGQLDSDYIEEIVNKSKCAVGFTFTEEALDRNFYKHFGLTFNERNSYASVQTYALSNVSTLTVEGLESVISNLELFMHESNLPLYTKPIEWFNAGVEMFKQLESAGYFSYGLFKDVQSSEKTILQFINRVTELQLRLKFVSFQYLDNKEKAPSIDIRQLTNELNPYANQASVKSVVENLKLLSLRANVFINNTRMKSDILRDSCQKLITEYKNIQTIAESISGRWTKDETLQEIDEFIKKLKDKVSSLCEEKEQTSPMSSSTLDQSKDSSSVDLRLVGASSSCSLSAPLNTPPITMKIVDPEVVNKQALAALSNDVQKWIETGAKLKDNLDKLLAQYQK